MAISSLSNSNSKLGAGPKGYPVIFDRLVEIIFFFFNRVDTTQRYTLRKPSTLSIRPTNTRFPILGLIEAGGRGTRNAAARIVKFTAVRGNHGSEREDRGQLCRSRVSRAV